MGNRGPNIVPGTAVPAIVEMDDMVGVRSSHGPTRVHALEKHVKTKTEILAIPLQADLILSFLEFLQAAAEIPFKPDVQEYRLDEANTALLELKKGKINKINIIIHCNRAMLSCLNKHLALREWDHHYAAL